MCIEPKLSSRGNIPIVPFDEVFRVKHVQEF